MGMDQLAWELEAKGVLKSQRIRDALCAVDRVNFVPEHLHGFAYADDALPIGYGQTISQPHTVIFMLELLDVKEGNSVFEVGYGSGWQTALLAYLAGQAGRVHAAEVVPRLCEFGRNNIGKYPELSGRTELFCQNALEKLSDTGKETGGFDRIVAAADIASVSEAWRNVLTEGGILVYPSGTSLWKETKIAAKYEVQEFPGFVFVPFIQA